MCSYVLSASVSNWASFGTLNIAIDSNLQQQQQQLQLQHALSTVLANCLCTIFGYRTISTMHVFAPSWVLFIYLYRCMQLYVCVSAFVCAFKSITHTYTTACLSVFVCSLLERRLRSYAFIVQPIAIQRCYGGCCCSCWVAEGRFSGGCVGLSSISA